MQNIQTLIFDLGGVIINLKTEQEWLEEDLLPNFNNEQLHQLQQKNFFNDFETGKIDVSSFIYQLKAIAINKFITEEEIVMHWNRILLDIPKHRVDFLIKLSEKYKLLLLSNTNYIHMDYIRSYMQKEFGEDILEATFHKCYYSQEIGLRKPHKEIYEFIMQQQSISEETILFLDDKMENLTEPKKLGWKTQQIQFNNTSTEALEYLL